MTKELPLRIITAVMLFALTVVIPLVPAPYQAFVLLFSPALFLVMLSAILCGWFEAFLIGGAAPFAVWALYKAQALVPDTLCAALMLSVSAVVTAVFYNVFKSSICACIGGILAGRIAFGISSVILNYELGNYYTIGDFFREAFTDVWPGLLCCMFGIPALIALFRKIGVMTVLRHERYER